MESGHAAETERFDVLLVLLRRWRTFIVFAVVGIGLSVAYALLAPQWYSARLTVVQSQRSQTSLAVSLASKLPDEFDTSSTDVQRINAVLRSNSVADAVIEKFDLRKHYGKQHLEHAREALWQHCSTTVDKKAGVVALECEDQDPQRTMNMTQYFGEVGNKVFGRVSVSSAREERKFLEAQVDKAGKDVNDASQKLREFQEKHKVIDLPEQSKAVISAMAQLQGELLSKELELSYLTSFSSRTEANVVQLEKQIRIMKSQLEHLESQKKTTGATGVAGGSSAEFFPDAMNVPALRFELEALLRQQ
jgi:capsule polysaccharide export protein KpsE/RkpR